HLGLLVATLLVCGNARLLFAALLVCGNARLLFAALLLFGNARLLFAALLLFGNARLLVATLLLFGNARLLVATLLLFGNARLLFAALLLFGNARLLFAALLLFGNARLLFAAPLLCSNAGLLFAFPGGALKEIHLALSVDRERRSRIFAYEIAQRCNVVLVEALPGDAVVLIEVIFREQVDRRFGALTTVGLLVDVRGDAPEHDPDFDPRLLEPLQQGRRERAVAASSVGGDVIRRSCVGNHCSLGFVYARKTACHPYGTRSAGHLRLQARGQGVGATGVEDQDLDAVDALKRRVHLVEADRLEADTELVLELGIGRHQIIAALELHGMAGIEEQRRIGVDGQPCELLQLGLHVALGRVNGGDNLPTQLPPQPTRKKPRRRHPHGNEQSKHACTAEY